MKTFRSRRPHAVPGHSHDRDNAPNLELLNWVRELRLGGSPPGQPPPDYIDDDETEEFDVPLHEIEVYEVEVEVEIPVTLPARVDRIDCLTEPVLHALLSSDASWFHLFEDIVGHRVILAEPVIINGHVIPVDASREPVFVEHLRSKARTMNEEGEE